MQKQEDIWNAVHGHYAEQDWSNKPSLFAITAKEYFPAAGSVLEIGGGLGQDARFFAAKGYDVTLTDLSSEALAQARARIVAAGLEKKIILDRLDASRRFPFAAESFEVVYAHLSLHYFDSLTTRRVFAEIHRVLKRDGIFAALTNSTSDPEYGSGPRIETDLFNIRGLQKRFFSTGSFREFAEGFEVLLLDDAGETYKDNAIGVSRLIRFIGRKSDPHSSRKRHG